MRAPLVDSTPTTLLTGFLGSGKTTLLNALLSDPALVDTAVLINEFGEIGIDHLLVEHLDENVVLLKAGCLCCTIRHDLVDSLSTLATRRASGEVPAFRRVVVETTGLADPVPVVHTLLSHESLRERFHTAGIVTTVDALNAVQQLERHQESLRQMVIADRLVITKTDLCDEFHIARLREQLRALNPTAPILRSPGDRLDCNQLLESGRASFADDRADVARWLAEFAQAERVNSLAGKHRHDRHRHDDRVRSFVLNAGQALALNELVAWIERLFELDGEKILRIKGLVDAVGSDVPLVVQGVGTVFHPITTLAGWPGEVRRTQIVVIGQDLDEAQVRRRFRDEVCRGHANID